MNVYPRITVVTPSFNQGAFIEATIRSVLDQGYPNLEYIVMDGGSTDHTVEILDRYDAQISHWVSTPDEGAADAIAKGFRLGTGEVFAYLNSDDIYLPNTLHRIAEVMRAPDVDVAFGNMYWMNADGRTIGQRRQTKFHRAGYLFGAADLMQPATFWTRELYFRSGGIDPQYRFTFDTDLFFRFVANQARFVHVNEFLASFRIHPDSKSTNDEAICRTELASLRKEHLPVPFDSLQARLIRLEARAHRALHYTLQGDLPWLLGRIPDRVRARWATEIVGPRARRV